VTMDDLLAQIFGVILDERTSLQASASQLRVTPRVRTPHAGVTTRAQSPTSEEVTPPATDIDELRRDGGN
jgi:hypothetical protein